MNTFISKTALFQSWPLNIVCTNCRSEVVNFIFEKENTGLLSTADSVLSLWSQISLPSYNKKYEDYFKLVVFGKKKSIENLRFEQKFFKFQIEKNLCIFLSSKKKNHIVVINNKIFKSFVFFASF